MYVRLGDTVEITINRKSYNYMVIDIPSEYEICIFSDVLAKLVYDFRKQRWSLVDTFLPHIVNFYRNNNNIIAPIPCIVDINDSL